MKKPHQRITQITILPEGEPIFSEEGTVITIADETSGEYVNVRNLSSFHGEAHEIDILPTRWPIIRDAIDTLMANISDWEQYTEEQQ